MGAFGNQPPGAPAPASPRCRIWFECLLSTHCGHSLPLTATTAPFRPFTAAKIGVKVRRAVVPLMADKVRQAPSGRGRPYSDRYPADKRRLICREFAEPGPKKVDDRITPQFPPRKAPNVISPIAIHLD